MKFLEINYIKQHSRIDLNCEDALLELYGTSAENTLLNLIGRTVEELKDMNGGEMPAPIIHAALILIENSCLHRAPSEPTNLYAVPYGVDHLVKPYIKL